MNTQTQIRFSSDFEITSNSPAFTKMVRECFGGHQAVVKTYLDVPPTSSKNRAKRARKKSKK
jgi:hypothetical protein